MFAEDPSKNISVLDQISSMIARYNDLAEEVKTLEIAQQKRENEVKTFKTEIDFELAELRKTLDTMKKLIDVATKQKMNVGSEFKQIIKQDQFNKLSRRIDALKYEDNLSRDELYRKVERATREE
jgi:hypothetical protein